MAEGVLHEFEGWVVFAACTFILILELWLMTRFSPGHPSLREVFTIDFPKPTPLNTQIRDRSVPKSFALAAALVLTTAILAVALPVRVERPPLRSDLSNFPLLLGDWSGVSAKLDQIFLDELRLSDYFLANYKDRRQHMINFYVAYYSSQSHSNATHSPKDCLPGGGWIIIKLAERNLEGVRVNDERLRVNRAVIQMGNARQLAYYWFQSGERVITDELVSRWFIFWDALTRSRTDGALVRLTTPIKQGETEADADDRLTGFLQLATKDLPLFVPK